MKRKKGEVEVLFVDDEPNIVDVVREFFKLFNVNASFAENGFEAISLCKKNKYKVIFIDYLMPGKNGLETAREIRKLLPSAYLVLITGFWTQFDSDELECVNEIMAKPFQLSSLLDIIHRIKMEK